VVVVNVWATWCKPCAQEIPDLSEVYDPEPGRAMELIRSGAIKPVGG